MENISLHRVCKSFDGRILFDNLDLTLNAGQITCIMGKSGCGKTTLMRMLMGLEPPDSGSITGIKNIRFSAVFQEDRLCPSLSASANAAISLPDCFTRSHSDEILNSLGLGGDLFKPVSDMSGGMRRRVALARALAADYDLLLLDEPFTGLDLAARNRCIQSILKYAPNKTLLIVTHDPDIPSLLDGNILDLESILHPQM